jgi:hypothetical protein
MVTDHNTSFSRVFLISMSIQGQEYWPNGSAFRDFDWHFRFLFFCHTSAPKKVLKLAKSALEKPLNSMQPATQKPYKSRTLCAQVMQPKVAPTAPQLIRLMVFPIWSPYCAYSNDCVLFSYAWKFSSRSKSLLAFASGITRRQDKRLAAS